jgi:Protein of unknown function (DUF4235)
MKDDARRTVAWKLLSLAFGAAAGLATDRVLTAAWATWSSEEPPTNPVERSTSWLTALSWAMATGVAVGVARLLANRSAAAVWEVALDEAPPGMSTPSHA